MIIAALIYMNRFWQALIRDNPLDAKGRYFLRCRLTVTQNDVAWFGQGHMRIKHDPTLHQGVEDLKRAIELNPDYWDAYNDLGNIANRCAITGNCLPSCATT